MTSSQPAKRRKPLLLVALSRWSCIVARTCARDERTPVAAGGDDLQRPEAGGIVGRLEAERVAAADLTRNLLEGREHIGRAHGGEGVPARFRGELLQHAGPGV